MASSREIYSEAEVAHIVKRAVELQEGSRAQEYTPGVTRDELARIAGEVGVDPAFLDQAIRERLNPPTPVKKSLKSWFGEPEERVVDGELAPEDYDLLAEELPTRAANAPPTQVGRTLTAKVMTGLSMADVSVTARRGRTRVRVAPFPLLPIIFSVQSLILGMAIGGSLISEKGAVAAGAAIMVAGVAGAMGLLVGGVNGAKATAKRLADRLAQRISDEFDNRETPPGNEATRNGTS